MCGLAGYLLTNGYEERAATILSMTRRLAHRGPDDEGITLIAAPGEIGDFATDQSAPELTGLTVADAHLRYPHRIALGHRRFSIIDTSTAGHQPFWSHERDVCVALNGELYNYVELRAELEALGCSFRTRSDTEVLAAAYLTWGVACFERMNGFWALALYDRRRDQVLVARDRLGKAPLYLHRSPRGLFWASEIKALAEAFDIQTFGINEAALADFVRTGRRDIGHQTLYADIDTFPNASYAWIEPDGTLDPTCYWRPPTVRLTPDEVPFQDAVTEVRSILSDALRIRMRADVPVGFELSGGMDSSSLVAVASSGSTSPLRAFTVSWPDSPLNEEPYAREVASRFSNVHYNVIAPSDDELITNLDSFVALMEQPFRTPSVFTYHNILRSMKAEGLRVSINGTGGDENFAGYAVYRSAYMRHLVQHRRLLQMARELEPSAGCDQSHNVAQLVANVARLGGRKAARVFEAVQHRSGRGDGSADPGLSGGFSVPPDVAARPGSPTDINALLIDYMGDGLMNYWQRVVNQSSMGVPLEVRSPFLDHRLIDFSFTLPLDYLMRNGWSKYLLRHAMQDLLPPTVTWRRQKSGFPFPTADWLALHKAELLSSISTIDSPYLDPTRTAADYDSLLAVDASRLWRVLSVGLWWKRCVENESLS